MADSENIPEQEQPDDKKDEKYLTMQDVLQRLSSLEEEAEAVLGASDDNHCTYNKGYIRQALYACKTCTRPGRRAAVCLACSFHCHEGHDLVELYTKRHFRCDCQTVVFEKKCTLDPVLRQQPANSENSYNQNFDGVYCVCSRPYPDPENDDDEMYQCVICEDWYHSKHLGFTGTPLEENDFDEVVCSGCMEKNDFLWRYAREFSATSQKNKDKNNDTSEHIDVEGESKEPKECSTSTEMKAVNKKNETFETDKDGIFLKPKGCSMPNEMPEKTEGACYWVQGWRSALCTCISCNKMYKQKKVAFLLDPDDTVQAYEEKGKKNSNGTQYEKGMKALDTLGHVGKVNVLEEYFDMKKHLIDFLRQFAAAKRIVREDDIREFFATMESRKRQKTDDGVQTFCR